MRFNSAHQPFINLKVITMIKETQQIIIIILGIIAVLCILKSYPLEILTTIIGILGGFLMGTKFTVSDSNIVSIPTDAEEGGDDVQ